MLLVRREHRHADPTKDGKKLRQGLWRGRDACPDGGNQGHILFTADFGVNVSLLEGRYHALLDPRAAAKTTGIDDVGHAAAR
jgi:hypothetical protein